MKKIGVVVFILCYFISCGEKKEVPEQNGDNIAADQETVDVVVQDQAEKDTLESQVNTTQEKPVKKLSKIKPADYTNTMNESELWDVYNQSKAMITRYKDEWDFANLINELNRTAQVAQKLNRPDIASWQYNNIGYYSITEFKKRTDYNSRMQDLQIMPYNKEKEIYLQETREKLRSEIALLEAARESLYDAIELNSQSPDKDREAIINSNLNFINNINEFINP